MEFNNIEGNPNSLRIDTGIEDPDQGSLSAESEITNSPAITSTSSKDTPIRFTHVPSEATNAEIKSAAVTKISKKGDILDIEQISGDTGSTEFWDAVYQSVFGQ